MLRGTPKKGKFKVPTELHKDISWWVQFMRSYNGVSIIGEQGWADPDSIVATDACLSGGGGFCQGEFFRSEFPEFVKRRHTHINALELWTVVAAAKLWGNKWAGKRIQIKCDNMTTVQCLNSGRCKDPLMLSLLRELEYTAATKQFEIRAVHIAGCENRIPDLLSRWHLAETHRKSFRDLAEGKGWVHRKIPTGNFGFSHKW